MSNEQYQSSGGRYMGDEVTLATAPNGAMTNEYVLRNLAELSAAEPAAVELAPGVHSIVGLAAVGVHASEESSAFLLEHPEPTSLETGGDRRDG